MTYAVPFWILFHFVHQTLSNLLGSPMLAVDGAPDAVVCATYRNT